MVLTIAGGMCEQHSAATLVNARHPGDVRHFATDCSKPREIQSGSGNFIARLAVFNIAM